MKQPTVPLTLCAAFVTAAAVVAFGDRGGVPGDAVATVDGVAVEQRPFDRRLAITAKTNGRPRAEVREQVTGGEEKVTEQQIADYYESNKADFKQPEQRDLRLVLTPSRAKAAAARAALDRGVSWSTVARRHSIDRATRSDGGKLLGVTRAEQDKRLADAVFEARARTLSRPVKARDGYYVFEVTSVFRRRQQSLEEARPTIEQLLVSADRRKKLDAFAEEFRAKRRSRTECREGYVTPECKNGPETAPQTAAQP
jgi:foldase protein PrsA